MEREILQNPDHQRELLLPVSLRRYNGQHEGRRTYEVPVFVFAPPPEMPLHPVAVGHSMVDYLKEYAERKYTDEEYESMCEEYVYARPFTKAQIYILS